MYIDPNSGGMLFQVLAVAFTAVSGFFLVFSGRIRTAIGQWRRRMRKEETPAQEEEKKS
jgi:hypothetical protein